MSITNTTSHQATFESLLRQPEGKQLEFKRDLSSPRPLLNTLVAFANTAGGQLIIGVTSNGDIVGVDDPLAEEERLTSLITDSIEPRLVPNIELFTLRGKTLMRVEVYLSSSRPHYLTKKGLEQGVMVRVGSSNRQADLQLVEELKRQVLGLSFDAMPMPELTPDDLDYPAMQNTFGNLVELDDNKLITLKLLVKHQDKLVPSRGAVLLFGRQRTLYFDDAWIQCGRFRGSNRVDIFDQADLYDHLPLAVGEIELFLKKHAYKTAEFGGMRRIDHWSVPLSILREAIINALVHSDYSQHGSPIRVAFYDDRIEIESPGLLMPGLTIEDMKRGVSMIRNPVIARVFRELKLIEQWGSGIERMYAESAKQGLPEPIIEELANRLRITIPLKQTHSIANQVSDRTHLDTDPTHLNADPTHLDTDPTHLDTDFTDQNCAYEKLLQEISLLSERPRKEKVIPILLKLCEIEAQTIDKLSNLLNRNPKSLKSTYLNPLRNEGLIEYLYPELINHPQQAYLTTKKGKAWLKQQES